MDVTPYLLEIVVRDRLEAARRQAARHALLGTPKARPCRRAARARLGRMLIALGEALAGKEHDLAAPSGACRG